MTLIFDLIDGKDTQKGGNSNILPNEKWKRQCKVIISVPDREILIILNIWYALTFVKHAYLKSKEPKSKD